MFVFARQAIAFVCLLGALSLPAQAQAEPATPDTRVTATAEDGLVLVADFYRADPDNPTVLLLHQLYSHRGRWGDLLTTLKGAGYNVLAVDLRGYGETRGRINWGRALGDVRTWLAWLRTESGVRGDAIHVLGSSMGSVLAIAGCDEACRSVVAISPGWRYYGIGVEDALSAGLVPVLAVYARRDRWPAQGIPLMIETAPEGRLTLLEYPGNAHGLDMLMLHEGAIPAILDWLARHNP